MTLCCDSMSGSYREATVLFPGAREESKQCVYLRRRMSSCCSRFHGDSVSVSCYMVIITSKGSQGKAAEI